MRETEWAADDDAERGAGGEAANAVDRPVAGGRDAAHIFDG